MANLEELGYCPYDDLINYRANFPDKVFSDGSGILSVLGDIPMFMLYPGQCKSSRLVSDMLMSTETLGLEVAMALRIVNPKCKYPDMGKFIYIHDFDNLSSSQVRRVLKSNQFMDAPDYILLHDEQFLVLIRNGETNVIMYIFKL